MEKIKVGIVNYLNTRPLIYGLERPPISEMIEIKGDYPSRVASMLISGEVDIALVPVAVLPSLPEYHIVGNYCIGTEGEIASVALFSEVPIGNITSIYLDYQSRSSVALLKYLMKESWKISPELIHAESEDFRNRISGTTAGLVIGDRALEQRRRSSFIYDLGSEWKKFTELPFVFAAWISIRQLPEDFILLFDKANEAGLEIIDQIVEENPYQVFDLKQYYTAHLSYRLDDKKRRGMAKFLEVIKGF